jgi:hypothetical protein
VKEWSQNVFAILLQTAVAIILSSPHSLSIYCIMGNAPIAPHERHNLASIPEVSLSQEVDPVSEMKRTKSIIANVNELESTPDKTTRYLPKTMNRLSNAGVIMPSRPYDCGGSSNTVGTESPQWGWYIIIASPTTEMYHSGSRRLRHKKTTRHLPKMTNRSNNGVIMPSKPYGCGGASTAGGIESPQWDLSSSVRPLATAMYHCRGSGSLPKKQDSSANSSQASSSIAASHQPNSIFLDMQKGASMGWSSVPL